MLYLFPLHSIQIIILKFLNKRVLGQFNKLLHASKGYLASEGSERAYYIAGEIVKFSP